ncbi:MAG: hypothetical protein IT562_14900 [Alphaproteobacteria bacterium]|nr:hypothetical protein [Alphaproteobacteria bacterium]
MRKQAGTGEGGKALTLAAAAAFGLGAWMGPIAAQTPPPPAARNQPPVSCQTIGSTTYCKDGTQFEQTQASSPSSAAAADGKPAVQNIGRSGPVQYQRDDLRVFSVDDRLRRLGEKQQQAPTGQQEAPSTYSGRNCGKFTTSVICD